MMTFLPFADFAESAGVLDDKRLQNQRQEALLVWEYVTGTGFDLSSYGAARMWLGFADALVLYYNACVREWIARGKNNTMGLLPEKKGKVQMPPWLGDSTLHASHRARLLFKLPSHYEQYQWPELKDKAYEKMDYVYPHELPDGRWGTYPQKQAKTRIVDRLCDGQEGTLGCCTDSDSEPLAKRRARVKAAKAKPPPSRNSQQNKSKQSKGRNLETAIIDARQQKRRRIAKSVSHSK
jgi:hypothetical protein